MKKTFFEYNMYDLGYVDEIKQNGLIILDTNSLLNLYRYNKVNREKFFEILKCVEDRLILTNKSVEEFYKNRIQIIKNKSNFKQSLSEELDKNLTLIENKIINNNFNCKNTESCELLKYEHNLKESIIKQINETKQNIKKLIDDYKNEINDSYFDDPILKKITELFDGKVNSGFDDEKLKDIYNEGKDRYTKKVPPGYEDLYKNKKPEPDCYGDLVIWKEMIAISKEKKKHILFVSDDTKEDWKNRIDGKDLGPRKELIREFHKETENMFYSFTTQEFIKGISELYKIKDTGELEQESKTIKEDLEKNENAKKITNSFEKFGNKYKEIRKQKLEEYRKQYLEEIAKQYLDYDKENKDDELKS